MAQERRREQHRALETVGPSCIWAGLLLGCAASDPSSVSHAGGAAGEDIRGGSGGIEHGGTGGTTTGTGGAPVGEAEGGVESAPDAGKPDGASPSCLHLSEGADTIKLTNCVIRITISKTTGRADYAWSDTVRLRGVTSTALLPNPLAVTDASTHAAHLAQATAIDDAFGTGQRVTLSHTSPGKPTIVQNYQLYDKQPFFFLDEEVTDSNPVSSNHLSPLVVDASGEVDIGAATEPRILLVPFHNDTFTRYDAHAIDSAGESYEATAIYDNAKRNALVLGSVTHDTWKTAIAYTGGSGKITTLEVYGGASSEATQDTLPHGAVSGNTIRSPRIFVGYFSDWRDGLEALGRANDAVSPRLHPWTGGVPFGFNTWAAYRSNVDLSVYQKVSDFFATSLVPNDFKGQSPVFINWDAGGSGIQESVAYAQKNGQKTGTYGSPFTDWGGTSDRSIEDPKGNPLPNIDNGSPIDPTNPDVKNGILSQIERWKSWGIAYVKLDFISHGVREGVHYDKTITTGVQAYNYGLKYIADAIGDSMFVDLSISPIFPGGQYAHGRRVSCDAFGRLGNSEYLMNNAGYGWWLSGSVYQYNDPDHTVVSGGTLEEGRTRVNATVISGTVFLDSDKLDRDTTAQSRAKMLLTNHDINELARRGKAFRPVEGNTGTKAPDLFVSREGAKYYVAVFNWSSGSSKTMNVDLARAGLDGTLSYTARDLWSGATSTVKGALPVTLAGAASTIVELSPGSTR
jgi:Alpha galactosidase C-terminal beta sandwich domain